ncbi:alkaline phosphatase family protein [Mycobacterium sp. 852014-52144_SCH5372336]|uniref:alkaline phosphatase family protein n=1 Tax=Mycobacterium sp. 852014-52144_SCH5372336 TaxID=1834115 RepID=UPI000801BCE0|nr:nucleotide pyrophosphatase/phosphodiesterase family protein [Mycobacterium sp. 852014-52144_SCH5372336]OBB72716.1 phosphodiesterase [Mycobacterium sp. 852014-52144_SCH5372336]
MELPTPNPALPHLAVVVPSILSAMGVGGFENSLGLADDLGGACVLLIDGLGAELLDRYAADAPTMASLRGRTVTVGFPSTTAAGLAAVGTGRRSGEHGFVGYSFRVPDAGVINALRWRPHPWGQDLRGTVIPEQVQPLPTTFERATSAGVAVSVISGAEFTGSGLTRAVLRGGRYVGVHALGDLAAAVQTTLSDGGFCYGYHAELDMLGHLYGPGSTQWRMQLRQIDTLIESVVEALPPGGLLAVVADHGMVEVSPGRTVDVDATPALLDGVEAVAGEARARHVYIEDGSQGDVLDAWRTVLGERAWVLSREEAIEAGWFGPQVSDQVRPRIGDVVAAARDTAAIVRRTAEPLESSLIGHHGSLTFAEQTVPLLLALG